MYSKSFKGIGDVTVIENDETFAAFDSFGAKCLALVCNQENILFYDENDISHSGIPLCFPSFGPLHNNEFLYKSEKFPINRHGFIRDQQCKKIYQTSDSITYQLSNNNETFKHYPFQFTFTVCYTIIDNGLEISCSMQNDSGTSIPVSPGLHPYFDIDNPQNVQFTTKAEEAYNNLDAYKLEKISSSDYFSILGEDEGVKSVNVSKNPDHHMPDHALEILTILRDGQKNIKLKTDLKKFKFMTVWRKAEDSKFICLEPSNIDNGLNIEPFIISPGKSFEAKVSISLSDC